MIWEELNQALIVTGMEASDYKDVMKNLGSVVIKEGYAKESYVDALIAREEEYPTGLDVDGMGVCDPSYERGACEESRYCHRRAETTGHLHADGDDDETVEVSLVFMLAVVDPNAHIDKLQRIVEMIQDKEMLGKLMKADAPEEMIRMIREEEKTI